MARNFKNAEAERLTREVERECRKPPQRDKEEFHRRIQAIVDDLNKLPVVDDRSADEIIDYNEQGHFD